MKAQKSIKDQIADSIRQRIQTGELKPNDSIASTKEIAEKFGTAPSNVHRALLKLVREGLIQRTPGNGTVVTPNLKKVRRVAVSMFTEKELGISAYRRMLSDLVCETLERRGFIPCPLYYRGAENLIDQLNSLDKNGEVQGAILSVKMGDLQNAIDRLTLPCAFISSYRINGGVSVDHSSVLMDAMTDMKKLGAKRVALLGTIKQSDIRRSAHTSETEELIRYIKLFKKAGEEHDIQTPDELILMPEDLALNPYARVEFAYEATRKLLRKEIPDALFIRSDDLLPGVIYALEEFKIQIPQDMRLVLGSNKELAAFSPFPHAKMELSITELAEKLTDTFEAVCRGEKISNKKVKPKYIPESKFKQTQRSK